jgi:hypothetical protein
MNSSNALVALKADIPALADRVAEHEVEWSPPLHVVYGDVFTPAMLNALKSRDESLLSLMFAHLEKLASSTDHELHDVAYQSVLESLSGWLSDHAKHQPIDHMMGPQTRRLFAWKPGDAPFRPTDT